MYRGGRAPSEVSCVPLRSVLTDGGLTRLPVILFDDVMTVDSSVICITETTLTIIINANT